MSLTQFSRNMGHEVTRREFRFSELIDEVLDELKYPYQAQTIKIIKNYSSEEIINSDYLRVKIIITNIISNALKYRYERRFEPYVMISLEKENGLAIVKIKDNGIGIERENQGKVFGMFFRGTDQSKGSGLGLYIVKETLEKMQGDIAVESEYGEYTLFTIKFPA
jgi:signal transduction histidine kinase